MDQAKCPTNLDITLLAGYSVGRRPSKEYAMQTLNRLRDEGLELSDDRESPENQLADYVERLQEYVRLHIRACLECKNSLEEKLQTFKNAQERESREIEEGMIQNGLYSRN